MIFSSPDAVLAAFLSGGEKALSLTLKLLVIYAVWMGVFSLAEKSGLCSKVAKLLRPANRLLFGELPEKANDYMSMNLAANLLGMSGATTPYGIKSVGKIQGHRLRHGDVFRYKRNERATYSLFRTRIKDEHGRGFAGGHNNTDYLSHTHFLRRRNIVS